MLKYEITHRYENISLPSHIEKEIVDRAVWNIEPTFLTQGRTAWHVLSEPVEIEYNGQKHVVKAVKMKGVGVYNPEGRHADTKLDKPIPPTDLIYSRDEPHFGFDKNSKIVKIHSEDAPYGGICHDRALREYYNAKVLFEHNVPTILPFMVIHYFDLFFNGRPMGAVLSLCTEEVPYRFLYLGWEDQYVSEEMLKYYSAVKDRLGVEGNISDVNVKLAVSKIIGRQFGETVRAFNEAGIFIHSGGWENMQFDMDKGRMFLTDLDSSRSLSPVSDKMKAITALRDFVSNLYRYINKLYYAKAIKIYDPEILLKYDVVFDLMKGYLPEIEDERLKEISKKIWSFFMPYFIIMKRNEDVLHEIPKKLRKSFKFNTDMFYILCLNLLYPEFLKSGSNTIREVSMLPEELIEVSKEYLGANFKYVEMYL